MTTITIHADRGQDCWFAAFLVDGKPDAEIVRLFDTHEIPTPFTLRTDVSEVRAALANLNPEATVEVGGVR